MFTIEKKSEFVKSLFAEQIAYQKARPEYESPEEKLRINTLILSNKYSKYVNIPEALKDFLKLVAEGEKGKAEAMLQQDPTLAQKAGHVTDSSNRFFVGITGLQYAVWALDPCMWRMILKYLPEKEAVEQIQAMDTAPWVAQHRQSADYEEMVGAVFVSQYGGKRAKDLYRRVEDDCSYWGSRRLKACISFLKARVKQRDELINDCSSKRGLWL